MKHTMRYLLGLLSLVICLNTGAQTLRVPLTSEDYTRGLLTNSTAAACRAYLGISLVGFTNVTLYGISTNDGAIYFGASRNSYIGTNGEAVFRPARTNTPIFHIGFTNGMGTNLFEIANDTTGTSVMNLVYDNQGHLINLASGIYANGNSYFTNDVVAGRFLNTPVTLTDASTIATDAGLGNYFRVTLGGSRTLGNPTNPKDGQRVVWEIKQDGSGSKTLAYDTKFHFGTDVTGATLTVTASKTDYLTAVYNLVRDQWDVVDFKKGY
jgi:hypothetical protein